MSEKLNNSQNNKRVLKNDSAKTKRKKEAWKLKHKAKN